jgi:hypothetical protein
MPVRLRQMLGTAEALFALWVGWVLVFAFPIRRTAAWFGGTTAPAAGHTVGAEKIRRAAYIARRVARLAKCVPWRTTCLVQALAGSLLLKRRGITAVVRFGVTKQKPGLAAHAWLIVGGRTVLGGEAAADFVPLADLRGKSP